MTVNKEEMKLGEKKKKDIESVKVVIKVNIHKKQKTWKFS